MYSYEDRIKAVELYINPGNRHLPGHFPQYGSLLYPAASFVNGIELFVDGGMVQV